MKLNKLLCLPLLFLSLLLLSSCATTGLASPATESDSPVTLEIYWATWCSWCKKEMAELDQATDYLLERGVEVVAIQVDFADNDRGYSFTLIQGNLPRGIASVPYHRIFRGTDLSYESMGYEPPNKLIKRALSVVNNQ